MTNYTVNELPEWLSSYLNESHTNDEVASHNGQLLAHWNILFNHLSNLSNDEINGRATEITQLLQNSRINNQSSQNWRIDPLPFMFSKADWGLLESGIIQRTKLLNSIQKDIYNGQKLLMDGHIQPQQLYQDRNYLRECFSLPPQELKLFFTAMDIYRDPYGQFKVLADHCQCPLGLGLLIKSRIIGRRVMAEEFAECGVAEVKRFLQLFQDEVHKYTGNIEDPRIVILTQGGDDPGYNEHAFLSTYFGYTLVQSADLTVRNGEVCLKSLQGLGKINAILRWIPDRSIDSLEQTEYSLYGIPGLLQAVRTGSVKVINPFGSGVLTSAAIKRQLGHLSNLILHEPLILNELNYYDFQQGKDLDWRELELYAYRDKQLCLDGAVDGEKIASLGNAQPNDYYFRDKVKCSTAPFLVDGKLIEKPVIFRFYALTTENGVEVLPSALCFSSQAGEEVWGKDTWISQENNGKNEKIRIPSPIRKRMDLTLLEGVISSRTAEQLFWLGRYLERCEYTVRILRVFIERYTDLAIYPDITRQNILIRLLAAIKGGNIVYPYCEQDFSIEHIDRSLCKQVAFRVLADKQCAGSIINTICYLTNAADQVRELLSYDSWRIIDDINNQIKFLQNAAINTSSRSIQGSLDKVMAAIMAFNGSVMDIMPNSNGWFLLNIGRRIERSMQITALTSTLLTSELDEAEELGLLEAVLSSQESLNTHKRRFRMYQSIETGIELLLLDPEYPRSLLFQLEQITRLCTNLPAKQRMGLIAPHDKAILLSKTACYLTDSVYLQSSENKQRKQLIEFSRNVRMNLDTFCNVLLLEYFTHTKRAKKIDWNNMSTPNSEI